MVRIDRAERGELLGQELDGRYRIQDRIGIGGTGVVFSATRLQDGASLVVKTMRPHFASNPDLMRRLRREFEVAQRVKHVGIVNFFDEGTLFDGSPYVVMERLTGESLSRLLLRVGLLAEDEAAVIAIRVASILHSVHRAGYVHRDVKPEHIWLDQDPENGGLRIQLLDFGVCASETAPVDERERERGRVYGTPSYVSPEQAAGKPEVDARADVWGLGVVLFESLCGALPFTANTVNNLLRRIIREDAPSVCVTAPHVSPEFELLIATALRREPAARFQTARAMARALAPFATSRGLAESRLAQVLRSGGEMPNGAETVRMRPPSKFAA